MKKYPNLPDYISNFLSENFNTLSRTKAFAEYKKGNPNELIKTIDDLIIKIQDDTKKRLYKYLYPQAEEKTEEKDVTDIMREKEDLEQDLEIIAHNIENPYDQYQPLFDDPYFDKKLREAFIEKNKNNIQFAKETLDWLLEQKSENEYFWNAIFEFYTKHTNEEAIDTLMIRFDSIYNTTQNQFLLYPLCKLYGKLAHNKQSKYQFKVDLYQQKLYDAIHQNETEGDDETLEQLLQDLYTLYNDDLIDLPEDKEPIHILEQLYELNPYEPFGHHELCQYYIETGQSKKAEAMYKKALENPNDEDTINELASLFNSYFPKYRPVAQHKKIVEESIENSLQRHNKN